MWALTTTTTKYFPTNSNSIQAQPLRYSLTNRTQFKPLKLKASSTSFFDYPLASRVIITNLPYSTSEKCLLENFSNFGPIAEVKLIKEKATRRSKGFAFIQFTTQDDAMLAIENMDRQIFDGRLIFLEIAKPERAAFRGYPLTSGPPKPAEPSLQEPEDAVDCWY